MKDPVLYMLFIREGIEKIDRFCGGDPDRALEDEKTLLAVQRVLETLSDATRHLPQDIKDRHPHIEWSKIIGFRNVLAHDYLGISTAAILDVVKVEIPRLDSAIKDMLKDHG